MIDATGAHALREVVDDLASQHITVIFKGLNLEYEQLLAAHGVPLDGPDHCHSYATLDEAIDHARVHILEPAT